MEPDKTWLEHRDNDLMRVDRIVVNILISISMIGCRTPEDVSYLWFVSSVRLTDSGDVALVAKGGPVSMLVDNRPVSQATLRRGDSILLTEGHHVWKVYEYQRTDNDRIVFRETTFHRPPLKKTQKSSRLIIVKPY